MIQLTFETPSAGSAWRDTWDSARRVNAAAISELDLCYKYFAVRVELASSGVEILSPKGHVTLVDFCLSLRHVLDGLTSHEDAALGFTESDNVIRIHPENNLIVITSSIPPQQVTVDREEFKRAVEEFLRAAYSQLINHTPELAQNPTIQKFAKI
ncbi:hypothetical protein [Streptomyces alkaliterrae]|uniref:Uncharacterized protein n=1 Tax=Streptomyces alkaliterrae TaxID=2213162 RepID=A0A5P0YZR8_9ACTN|nr:hypothetical protein [Streptomyces alkaliterrae]MBB1261712.1 hypothetical protein [Streptomyces alkaliterrae]MQS04239.1 hypothetical protein [Streptomyces alkaliterrae]